MAHKGNVSASGNALVEQLPATWSRLRQRREPGDPAAEDNADQELHLWAEGPLPKGLMRCLRCGDKTLH